MDKNRAETRRGLQRRSRFGSGPAGPRPALTFPSGGKAAEAPAGKPAAGERLKVSYVTTYDAAEISHWSGTGYHIATALEASGCSLDRLGPLPHPGLLWPLFKAKGFFYNHLLRQRYHAEHDAAMARHYARVVGRRLRDGPPTDVVFSPGVIPIARLRTSRPIAFWSDATHACLFDFYPEYSGLAAAMRRDGHRIEESAIQRAAAAIFSSQWAADSAIRDYGADPAKVHVVPYGANLEPPSAEAVSAAIMARPHGICKLLFIGVDWVRKGGATALAVAEALNRSGLPAELTVVGCNPFAGRTQPDFLRCEGFLSKESETGRRRIMALLAESHFLLVPSRAECFGIVYCEANAFGVPCLARSVGGIPTIVKSGRNGYLVDPRAPPDHFARLIRNLFADYGRYRRLARSSLVEYQARLNWSVAGERVRQILQKISTDR